MSSTPLSALRRLAVVMSTAAVVASLATPAVASAPTSPAVARASAPSHAAATSSVGRSKQSARIGAGWLARQITGNGGSVNSFGFPDASNTAYAVVGLHAAGVGRAASNQAIAYLKTQLGEPTKYDDGSDNPGVLANYILAAVSAGQNPYRFGGSGAANNLVARLLATQRSAGVDAGLFGSADPTYDGAFRQGAALDALKAAGVRGYDRRVVRANRWLIEQQCGNGLWTAYRADISVACPAADPNTFSGPDTNSTAMAVQGLAAYRRFPHYVRTLASLRAVQSGDGGFPYLAVAGSTSDPNSTALTLQALLADRVAVRRWQKVSGGRTVDPISALASFQLGCSAPAADRGAYFYPGDESPNVLATVQAVPAAAGLPLSRVHRRQVSRAVPVLSCPAAPSRAAHATVTRPTTAARATRLADGLTVNRLASAATTSTLLAGVAGPCKGSTGVTVSVDFTAFAKPVSTRCATGTPATGVAALQQAGFTPAGTQQYGLAFVCRINSLPSTTAQSCVRTPPATAYWAYYYANVGATTWTYSSTGPSSFKPAQGSVQAWAFGNSAKPSKTPAQVRAGL